MSYSATKASTDFETARIFKLKLNAIPKIQI